MLDSPYVRRVAIALLRLGLPFEHRPISLFRHIDEFAAINPLLKAPTLVADDGTVLMDSTLIIDHAATLAPAAPGLSPRAPKAKLRATRLIGLSLAVCEKAVQFHYERALRPPEKQHEPWAARVRGQLYAGLDALEREINGGKGWLFEDRMTSPTSPWRPPTPLHRLISATSSHRRATAPSPPTARAPRKPPSFARPLRRMA